jgi:hypothetical protein
MCLLSQHCRTSPASGGSRILGLTLSKEDYFQYPGRVYGPHYPTVYHPWGGYFFGGRTVGWFLPLYVQEKGDWGVYCPECANVALEESEDFYVLPQKENKAVPMYLDDEEEGGVSLVEGYCI